MVALGFAAASVAQSGSVPSKAPPSEVPKFAPVSGITGYQEIKLSEDSWYVAFHGQRKHSMELVEAGWGARVAQLCTGIQRAYFVQLRYVGEPILKTSPAAAVKPLIGSAHPVGMVYIPIFIPQAHRAALAVVTPSKSAAIRCVQSPDALLDRSRAFSVTEALSTARQRGLQIP